MPSQHVIPDLGPRKPTELTAEDVDRWPAAKARTLSTRTLRDIKSILRHAATRAQARDKVKRNVVLLCARPRQGRSGARRRRSPSTRRRR